MTEGKREEANKEKEKKVREDTDDHLMTGKEERNGQEGRVIERRKEKEKGTKRKQRNRREKREENDKERNNRNVETFERQRRETVSSNNFSQACAFWSDTFWIYALTMSLEMQLQVETASTLTFLQMFFCWKNCLMHGILLCPSLCLKANLKVCSFISTRSEGVLAQVSPTRKRSMHRHTLARGLEFEFLLCGRRAGLLPVFPASAPVSPHASWQGLYFTQWKWSSFSEPRKTWEGRIKTALACFGDSGKRKDAGLSIETLKSNSQDNSWITQSFWIFLANGLYNLFIWKNEHSHFCPTAMFFKTVICYLF